MMAKQFDYEVKTTISWYNERSLRCTEYGTVLCVPCITDKQFTARVDGTEHKARPSCGEGMDDYYEEDKYYLIIRSTGLFNGCL